MNVRELIKELQGLDPDSIVVLQKDSEGNGYSPLTGANPAWYDAESTWSGEVYPNAPKAEDDDEDDDDEDDDDEAPAGSVPCVVLYPVN